MKRFYQVEMLVEADESIPPFACNGENEPTSFFRMLVKAIEKPGLAIVDSDVSIMTAEEAEIEAHRKIESWLKLQ